MGRAIETIGIQATAPGTGAAGAAFSGNSLTIRDNVAEAYIIDVWQRRQAAGITRLTSPLMHDTSVGLQGTGPIGVSMLYRGWDQPVFRQDTISALLSGSAVAGDIEQSFVTVLYMDLPGVAGRFMRASEVDARSESVYSFTNTLALGTSGGWSGEESAVSEQDQWKANRDYAVLGATIQVGAGAVRMRGPDSGNLGAAIPAGVLATDNLGSLRSERYWYDLSRYLGDEAVIPIVNASNKSLLLIDGATDENGTDSVTIHTLALLAPSSRAPRRSRK